MESAMCFIKEAVQAIQELDFVENTCSINRYIHKRMQTMNMEDQRFHWLFTVYFNILNPYLFL